MSVCIPTRDRAALLPETLRSVLGQEGVAIEVVVYDDGSRDGTGDLVAELRDPRVRYLRSDVPRGVSHARNRCLSVASGELIAWIDSDDVYEPNALRVAAGALDASPSAVLFHAHHAVIDAAGDPLPDWPSVSSSPMCERGADAFDELILENYIASPTAVARRAAHERVGPYDESLRSGEDWHMWGRLALEGDVVYSPERLASYRYHADGLSGRARSAGSELAAQRAVLDRWFGEDGPDVPQRDRRERRARRALAARALRHVGEARARGDLAAAFAAVELAESQSDDLSHSDLAGLRRGLEADDDFAVHESARRLGFALAGLLAGSRFGERLRRETAVDGEWRRALREIAAVARRQIPPGAAVAVLDKWDPTLRHYLDRPGRTFPDRAAFPDGYPRTDAEAIADLERLRDEGVRFLVATSATAWWFDHYDGFARHVGRRYRLAWRDARCLVYDLS